MPNKKPKKSIKPGDIIKLGPHRLLVGDAADHELVARLVSEDKINMIFTDVPYGIDYVKSKESFNHKVKKNKDISNDNMQNEIEYQKFTTKWLKNAIPFLTKKNSVYIFNSDKMIFALREGMKEAGINFSQLLIWIKNQAIIGRKDYMLQHELIATGWYGSHKFYKSKDKSVLFAPKPKKSSLHPTTKPVSLLRKVILNSTQINDIIYDPFAGSGSLLIACEQTKRKCLLVEIDLEYCQTIINTYNKLAS